MSTSTNKQPKPADNNTPNNKPEGVQTRVTVNTFVFKCDENGIPQHVSGELKNRKR